MSRTLPHFFQEPHVASGCDPTAPVLVGLSGGSDSVALLHLLCACRESIPFPLYAAHVNHGIRTESFGNEAARDEKFCRELCQRLGVELFVGQIDVPRLAEASGSSLETEARNARYAYFAKIMQEKGIRLLVTAHNADDNLETQIFNLCRGCGIDGIRGIPALRPFDAVKGGLLYRPILSATKAEILNFCLENHLDFVTDSTNLEDDCTRNRIRHRVIPELTNLFGSPQKAGLRLSATAEEDGDYLLSVARDYLAMCKDEIKLDSFNALHPAIAKRVVRIAFSTHSSETLESIHVDSVIDFAKERKRGKISLPGQMSAVFNGEALCFTTEGKTADPSAPFDLPLSLGFTPVGSGDFAVLVGRDPIDPDEITQGGIIYKLYTSALVKHAKIEALRATSRREGDRIRDGGVGKRVKKLMCDRHLEPSLRDKLPLIREGEEIIYVPECAVADRVKATASDFEYNISIYKKE